jgi:hypothetical protein
MKSFFHGALAFFKKVFTNTDWTHAAQVAIQLSAPLVETLAVQAGGPGVGQEVTGIMNEIKTDFGVAAVTLGQIQAAPGNVNAITLLRNTLVSIKTNLQGLEQLAEIKDPGTKLTVSTIVGEVDAILTSVPAPAAA